MTSASSDRALTGDARARRSLQAERLWSLALAAVVLVVIVSSLIVAAAPSPVFCGTCHGQEVHALAETAHKGVRCDACHTGSTTFGFAQSRLRVLDMVARQLVPLPSHAVASIDSARCLTCHAKDLAEKTTGDIRMDHRAPIEKGWACAECHSVVAHPSKQRLAVGYTMDTCMRCHTANAKDPASCETCHAGRAGGENARSAAPTPWRVTHGPNWRHTHGMGDLQTCKNCHPGDYCVTCHSINVPHPDSYISLHGRDVLGRPTGSKDCETCHRASSCDNCHGILMPHPDGFLKVHKAEVKRLGEPACLRCHAKTSCDGCHVRHTHPGLPVDLREWLQARPVD